MLCCFDVKKGCDKKNVKCNDNQNCWEITKDGFCSSGCVCVWVGNGSVKEEMKNNVCRFLFLFAFLSFFFPSAVGMWTPRSRKEDLVLSAESVNLLT